MPIRTNRGRVAVYRRLWGWPLRSPRHLVITLVGFAAVAMLIGVVVPKVLGTGAVASSTTQTTSRPPGGLAGNSGGNQVGVLPSDPAAASTVPTRQSSQAASPSSAAPSPDMLFAATSWARAFVKHPAGITNAQWLEQLKPYTTDEFLPVMNTIEPSNVPASQVTGPATTVESHQDSAVVTVPTNDGTLKLVLVKGSQGWRVGNYTKAN
ncbi:hypothetical protein F0L68_09230 [Solihabitans fulvus]|uniref:Uncharacterized protein n=1 Tax=Solihabitans fulvus TaxID=1892852 RepID=A0A5B2XLL9_9PSEU|nr:hypothetical protein [Solihabitans fulvus]KAA2263840.1 hypothetical protein F0L68_09230 [Solihabitans fulvus]